MQTDPSTRGQWGSRLGFILAAAGSAVGLGNIWRFPYVTGENGGGAFVLIYIACTVVFGLAVMWAELAVGRATQQSPVSAFGALAPGSLWKLVGYLGVVTGAGILSFYGVVAGWTVGYLLYAVGGDLSTGDPGALFGRFVERWELQVTYLVVFMGLTLLVILGGVRSGIERLTKILMPALVVLLLGLIVNGLFQPKAADGLSFYLMPDFSKVTGMTFMYALGQAFFSLSLGMGAMLTYGSYLKKDDGIAAAGAYVVLFDTAIALLAGLMIFPMLGGKPAAGGPGLVFVVLTKQFQTMPAGQWIAILFFALLAVAALTSTVSLLEVVTSSMVDEWKFRRRPAALLATLGITLLGVPSALSLGGVPWLTRIYTVGGKPQGFLDLMNFIFGNIALAVGALLLCLFVTLRWGIGPAVSELCQGGAWFGRVALPFRIAVTWLCPAAVIGLLLYMVITGQSLG
ncbi:MAG: sodium-dependent transporter [Polyangia bacterium]|nr:sodium-dependent transporter [Polyangia bacterium]